MVIKYLAQACFLVTGESGLRVMIDPYEAGGFGGRIPFARIADPADVVLVTHEHADHNHVAGVPGSPVALRGTAAVSGVTFTVTSAFHDDQGGAQRGESRIFSFTLEGVSVCHLGDLGEPLTPRQVAQVGRVDVLLVPVGGFYTIDAAGAWEVVEQLGPRVVIPMHYRGRIGGANLAPVDGFLAGQPNVRCIGAPQVAVSAETLPAERTIYVLEMANA